MQEVNISELNNLISTSNGTSHQGPNNMQTAYNNSHKVMLIQNNTISKFIELLYSLKNS